MAPAKNNEKAVQLRQEGNQLYREQLFEEAIAKYKESICWAESDSEHVGMAYGNISAMWYGVKEYEFALANIALAKRHNYPERLMPKLEARERSCLQLKGDKFRHHEEDVAADLFPKLVLNVEVNPRIPHMARGIHVEEDPKGGTMMVADRDFKVGDVILSEKPLVGSVKPDGQYHYCDYCLSCMVCGFVPCPHCVSTVYCNEQCLEKGWNIFHRFECDIRQELHKTVGKTGFAYTGVRMFLYGLSLFKDDVDKMMEFRKANPRTGSDPLKLDFVNYDPMEEFKTVSTARHRRTLSSASIEPIADQFYNVYQKNSLIQSLFNDKTKKDFLFECFVDFLKVHPWRNVFHSVHNCSIETADEFFTIASNFSLKPYKDANLAKVGISGHAKLVVHRPVKKGDQLKVQRNMDPAYYACTCSGNSCTDLIPNRSENVFVKVLKDPNIDFVAKMNAYQQFIQANSSMFNRCFFKSAVQTYHTLLAEVFMQQMRHEFRAMAK